jgi:hypothetical protein
VGHTATSAKDGVGGVKAVAHTIEREGGEGGNGWRWMAMATSFHPGPTHQREKEGKRETTVERSRRRLTRTGEGARAH